MEGDTLVVEVTGLNGRGWFDSAGNFYGENTRLVERWRMVDANTIDSEVTIEDPTLYTRPWKMNYPKRRARRAADDPYAKELWEVGCHEGNAIGTESIHSLGFKWYKGVTPPK